MQNNINVLLIDDEPIVGSRLKPALAKIGCNVDVFENPQKAIEKIKNFEYEVVITDIVMNNINGIQILEEVRKKSDKTKVIIITGFATAALAREAMEKGAYDMIAKPFKPADLRKIVSKALTDLGYKDIGS
ncbi:MAG: response regulator [Desulfonatronovibrio sp.]|nr:response regulator [Desulfovibrionales bacterium]